MHKSRFCYNRRMRLLLLSVLLGLLWVYPGVAADQAAPEEQVATTTHESYVAAQLGDCCHPLCIIEGCLKHRPLCSYPQHKCLTPCEPCAVETCLPRACHKPLTPCVPEACDPCPPRACHKPLVVFMPECVCESVCDEACPHGCRECREKPGSDD